MEAVYTRGPIAVSLDASQPSFRFYSGGDALILRSAHPTCSQPVAALTGCAVQASWMSPTACGSLRTWTMRCCWSAMAPAP